MYSCLVAFVVHGEEFWHMQMLFWFLGVVSVRVPLPFNQVLCLAPPYSGIQYVFHLSLRLTFHQVRRWFCKVLAMFWGFLVW